MYMFLLCKEIIHLFIFLHAQPTTCMRILGKGLPMVPSSSYFYFECDKIFNSLTLSQTFISHFSLMAALPYLCPAFKFSIVHHMAPRDRSY